MALKYIVDSVDNLSDEMKELYEKQSDGTFQLKVEGAVSKRKIDEFRNNNINLSKDLEDFKKKYEGIDVEEYSALKKKQIEMADKKLIEEGKLEELVESRVSRMRADFDSQSNTLKGLVDKLNKEKEDVNGRLSEVLIDGEISKAASKIGSVRQGAMLDIQARGKRTWKLVDGVPKPLNSDGSVMFGKDGKAPMTFDEWSESFAEEAPFLFEGSSGSGASGSDTFGGSGKKISASQLSTLSSNSLEQLSDGSLVVE